MSLSSITQSLSLYRLRRSVVLGLKSLWMHKLRSFLTALGIVFGVCSVITMLAIGEGASYEAQQQIKDLGSQNIILQSEKPTSTTTSGEQTRSLVLEYGITYRDIAQIQSTIPGVEVTVPSRTMKDYVWRLSRSVDGDILGTIPWYPRMKNRDVIDGRFFTQIELNSRGNVCVINEGMSRELFPLEDPIGKAVRVRQSYFRVLGVIEDKKKKSDAGDADLGGIDEAGAVRELLVPITTLNEHFGKVLIKYRSGSFEAEKVELHEAIIRIEDPDRVFPAAQAIRHLMERNHKDADYKMTVPLDLLQQAEKTKRIFNIVLGSIAAISLIVGGIGIMNIMLATVTERTREIGIRRALGAKRKDIVLQFLVETVLLSGAGGLIGVALGLTIPLVISYFAEMKTIVLLWAPTLAFTISVLTGILFGIYPAFRAAGLSPVEALRHE